MYMDVKNRLWYIWMIKEADMWFDECYTEVVVNMDVIKKVVVYMVVLKRLYGI